MSRSGEAVFGRALRALGFGANAEYGERIGLSFVPPHPWPGDAARGRSILGNTIELAGQSVAITHSAWDTDAPEPWRAALNSFEWLRDLRAVGGDAARRQARALTAEWLTRYERRGELAWRADIMGARLANWIGFHDFFCASADDAFRTRLFDSMGRQAKSLARALPGDLGGAPLLLAIKGLLATGLCLPGGDGRFAQAEKLLFEELPRQILADGCHIERCPSVHAMILEALIDIRALYKTARVEMPPALQHAIDHMTPALRFYRHGDGRLALFNGSDEGEALMIDTVLTQADARGRPLRHAAQAGFDRVTMGRTVVIADTGGPAPAGFDRTAHAGIGSFEMSIGRERFIVNCGHSGTGALQSALAGTAAHSTLAVADTNQMQIAATGGVKRRPRTVESRREDQPEGSLIEVSHDGYADLGLVHRRRLFLRDGGDDFRGEDTLVGSAVQPFAIRFHLHPDVHASVIQNGRNALLRLGDNTGWRLRSDSEAITLVDSIYFGGGSAPRRSLALVIVGTTKGDAETTIRWAFHREKRIPSPRTDS